MKRDWTAARAKCDASVCRSCGTTGRLDAAHIISRSIKGVDNQSADNILPLCRSCHEAQHRGELKLIASGASTFLLTLASSSLETLRTNIVLPPHNLSMSADEMPEHCVAVDDRKECSVIVIATEVH